MTLYGPYTRDDGRKHVIVYDPKTKKRRTISYPKYLMMEYLGRELEDWETVDHRDDDFTNDAIDNLQILSRGNNALKSSTIKGKWYTCAAVNCEVVVFRPPSQVKGIQVGVFCSNGCRSKTFGNQHQIKGRIVQLVGDN